MEVSFKVRLVVNWGSCNFLRCVFENILKIPTFVVHVFFSRVLVLMCLYTTSWEMRNAEVSLSMRVSRVFLGLFSVARMANSILAPLLLMVDSELEVARIILESSVFTDLMLE